MIGRPYWGQSANQMKGGLEVKPCVHQSVFSQLKTPGAQLSRFTRALLEAVLISPPLWLLFGTSLVGFDSWSLWYLSRPSSTVIGRLGKK